MSTLPTFISLLTCIQVVTASLTSEFERAVRTRFSCHDYDLRCGSKAELGARSSSSPRHLAHDHAAQFLFTCFRLTAQHVASRASSSPKLAVYRCAKRCKSGGEWTRSNEYCSAVRPLLWLVFWPTYARLLTQSLARAQERTRGRVDALFSASTRVLIKCAHVRVKLALA